MTLEAEGDAGGDVFSEVVEVGGLGWNEIVGGDGAVVKVGVRLDGSSMV